jgi:RNase adaptor protein for sRNA GlmZ degradation
MPKIREYDVKHDSFTVTISSFSYKNGVPQDTTGNGGGFVFDCRYLNNPGRYNEFKELNGREKENAVNDFFNHTFHLVEQAIDVYLKRGFTNLSVSFGCTGGQHRSVYMAERLAANIKSRHKLNVILNHQELDKNPTI